MRVVVWPSRAATRSGFAPALESLGVIGELDEGALAAYCLSYARWREAEAELEREGLVVTGHRPAPRKHPAAQLARDYSGEMRSWAKQLGLTPASRQSFDMAQVHEYDDRLAEILG